MHSRASVVILTLNEENNMPKVLASLAGWDDIVVLDSGSTDRTAAIATAHGARVFVNPFRNFAQQRNFAHDTIPFRHEWVFHLDADELMTPELTAECAEACSVPEIDGYWVAPKMLWKGHWVPHCTDYPAYQARLGHRDRFRFIEKGHGQREAEGLRLRHLQANYTHDMSASGVEDWLAKHRRYAHAEAELAMAQGFPWGELFARLRSADALVRRRALKQASFALPARPLFRLVYQYILRRGFLDGAAGWEYCRLLSRYEGFVAAELRRLRRAN